MGYKFDLTFPVTISKHKCKYIERFFFKHPAKHRVNLIKFSPFFGTVIHIHMDIEDYLELWTLDCSMAMEPIGK